MPLTDQHRAILDYERDHPVWRYVAAKETDARGRFGMSAVRYYQVVGWLLSNLRRWSMRRGPCGGWLGWLRSGVKLGGQGRPSEGVGFNGPSAAPE